MRVLAVACLLFVLGGCVAEREVVIDSYGSIFYEICRDDVDCFEGFCEEIRSDLAVGAMCTATCRRHTNCPNGDFGPGRCYSLIVAGDPLCYESCAGPGSPCSHPGFFCEALEDDFGRLVDFICIP